MKCSSCNKDITHQYMMCDIEEGQWCIECFELTPCGKEEHGEECPTMVTEE